MKKKLFILLVSCLMFSCIGQTDNKVAGKNKHQYQITIKNPKFHILQIPQPLEYVYDVKINGESSIRHFSVQILVTSMPDVYVELETNLKKHSGVFNGNAQFEISYIKGYSGFILWIDGRKVAETSSGTLKYNYQSK